MNMPPLETEEDLFEFGAAVIGMLIAFKTQPRIRLDFRRAAIATALRWDGGFEFVHEKFKRKWESWTPEMQEQVHVQLVILQLDQ